MSTTEQHTECALNIFSNCHLCTVKYFSFFCGMRNNLENDTEWQVSTIDHPVNAMDKSFSNHQLGLMFWPSIYTFFRKSWWAVQYIEIFHCVREANKQYAIFIIDHWRSVQDEALKKHFSGHFSSDPRQLRYVTSSQHSSMIQVPQKSLIWHDLHQSIYCHVSDYANTLTKSIVPQRK